MYSTLGAEFSVLLIAVNNISSAKLTKATLGKGQNREFMFMMVSFIFEIYLWNILKTTLNQRIQRADEQALSRMVHLVVALIQIVIVIVIFFVIFISLHSCHIMHSH